MKIPRSMLVETVMERKGEKMVQVESLTDDSTALYKKVPNLIPVGVFVGINDHGIIRIGHSKAKLPPKEIPSDLLHLMRADAIMAYEKARKNSDTFSKERGIAHAFQNMLLGATVPTGRGYSQKYEAFKKRCIRYFKDLPAICENGQVTMVQRVKVKKPGIAAKKTGSDFLNKHTYPVDKLDRLIEILK